jgi:hypothetical protein
MRFTYRLIQLLYHCQDNCWQGTVLSPTIGIEMIKDAPLAFRIQADLKRRLLKVAKQEARSLSQICEMLLRIGVDEYDKEGHKYLQKSSTRGADQG